MENKINIAELLKDCPQGMELDCTMFENLEFDRIDKDNKVYPIRCRVKTEWGSYNFYTFTEYGCYGSEKYSKCVIFPKGKTTWEGFQRPFVDGDIVTWEDRGSLVACIYKKRENITTFNHHIALYNGNLGIVVNGEIVLTDDELCFATEEEKEKLFDAIKANGYKWNMETKTLEKSLEFKNGDIIFKNNFIAIVSYIDPSGIIWYRCWYNTLSKQCKIKNDCGIGNINDEEDIRIATEEEKQKLFNEIKNYGYCWNAETKILEKLPKFKVGDKIKYKNGINKDGVKEGIILSITDNTYDVAVTNNMGIFIPIADQDNWELVPNKFDINTLVPLESKVLVRNVGYWVPAFWGYYSKEYKCPFVVDGGNTFAQCIPYEGNEHLLGTTDDCDEYYKNWK